MSAARSRRYSPRSSGQSGRSDPRSSSRVEGRTSSRRSRQAGQDEPVTGSRRLAVRPQPKSSSGPILVAVAVAGIIVVGLGMMMFNSRSGPTEDPQKIEARELLHEARMAEGEEQERRLNIMIETLERNEITKPYLDEAEIMLRRNYTEKIIKELNPLLEKKMAVSEAEEVDELISALEQFRDVQLADEKLLPGDVRTSKDRIDKALQVLKVKQHMHRIAEVKSSEEDQFTEFNTALRKLLEEDRYMKALEFIDKHRDDFRVTALLKQIDQQRKDLIEKFKREIRETEAAADEAFVNNNIEAARAGYEKLIRMGEKNSAARARDGLERLESKKEVLVERAEERDKQQEDFRNIVTKAMETAREMQFDRFAREMEAAKARVAEDYHPTLEAFVQVGSRAHLALESLAASINQADPKIPVEKVSPGFPGVFKYATPRQYNVVTDMMTSARSWRDMEKDELFKLAGLILPENADNLCNLASLAALTEEIQRIKPLIEAAAAHDKRLAASVRNYIEKTTKHLPE